MSEFDRDALTLETTDARYLDEMERVRLDARMGDHQVSVDLSAEAVEELAGEAPLSRERLIDTVEAHRPRLARIARDKVRGTPPAGGVVLLTMRDMPKATAPGSSRSH